MKIILFIFLFTTLSTKLFAYPQTPNPKLSPGKICTTKDIDFNRFRYQEQIPYCKRNVHWETKKKVLQMYNVNLENRRNYIIDHIIPLSIGGSNHIDNLWPEHLQVKRELGTIEDDMFEAVSRGNMTQKDAVKHIMVNKYREHYSPAIFPL